MYHFSRLFKQSTGLSPYQYVTNSRIEKAKRLLVQTEEAINQIGQQVGFPNQSHFTNVFRKAMGVTPKAYREKVRI
jgi:AraC family transcriptional regulator